MALFSVYYADGSVHDGNNRQRWRSIPTEGVQAVVVWQQPPVDARGVRIRPWRQVEDRRVWTGDDLYDPLGFGNALQGSLILDEDYHAIAAVAMYGPSRAAL